MIEIDGLVKTYPGNIRALRGINLRIEGQGMFGLLGPNGAGKTTLMRILAGIQHPTAGRVSVFGHDLNTPRGRQGVKALLGYLPQELGMHPDLTAREFLDYIAILKGLADAKRRRQQIDELLELVRLSGEADLVEQLARAGQRLLGHHDHGTLVQCFALLRGAGGASHVLQCFAYLDELPAVLRAGFADPVVKLERKPRPPEERTIQRLRHQVRDVLTGGRDASQKIRDHVVQRCSAPVDG